MEAPQIADHHHRLEVDSLRLAALGMPPERVTEVGVRNRDRVVACVVRAQECLPIAMLDGPSVPRGAGPGGLQESIRPIVGVEIDATEPGGCGDHIVTWGVRSLRIT